MRTTSNNTAETALSALAAGRLTRFVTQDWLGEWLIARPVKRWAEGYELKAMEERERFHETICEGRQGPEAVADHKECTPLADYNPHDPITWQAKVASALDCPFCIGFWIGLGILAVNTATAGTRLAGPWRGLKTALALNYVVGHVSARIDS